MASDQRHWTLHCGGDHGVCVQTGNRADRHQRPQGGESTVARCCLPVVKERWGALKKAVTRDLVGVERAYDVPQALFDLATIHCTKVPSCATCPMRSVCPSAETFLTSAVRTPKRTINKANETHHRNKRFPPHLSRADSQGGAGEIGGGTIDRRWDRHARCCRRR